MLLPCCYAAICLPPIFRPAHAMSRLPPCRRLRHLAQRFARLCRSMSSDLMPRQRRIQRCCFGIWRTLASLCAICEREAYAAVADSSRRRPLFRHQAGARQVCCHAARYHGGLRIAYAAPVKKTVKRAQAVIQRKIEPRAAQTPVRQRLPQAGSSAGARRAHVWSSAARYAPAQPRSALCSSAAAVRSGACGTARQR